MDSSASGSILHYNESRSLSIKNMIAIYNYFNRIAASRSVEFLGVSSDTLDSSILTLTPGRTRNIAQDMEALRLSRQDNPFLQVTLHVHIRLYRKTNYIFYFSE